MALLELQNISFESEGKTILKNLSLKIKEGDFISIIGPSGSGKSTLLKLCSDLISPTTGELFFNNKSFNDYNPTDLRKTIAYCFQTPYLFGDTVMDNLIFPYAIRQLKVDENRIKELFSKFHMSFDYTTKAVRNLSGGEKQRISLIRSLLFTPKVLLLDEATSALDEENALIVEKIIADVHKAGTTILWITHNLEQSRKYANKILTIEAGEATKLEEVSK